MTQSPNQAAFIAANEIIARQEQTTKLFLDTLPILQQGLTEGLHLTTGFYEYDKSRFTQDFAVVIRPIHDEPAQPTQDKAEKPQTPLQRFRNLAQRAATPQPIHTDKQEDWLHIWMHPNGLIQIKSGTEVSGFLDNRDAHTLQAGTYENPQTIVTQILLAITQADTTKDRSFAKLVESALKRVPITTPAQKP